MDHPFTTLQQKVTILQQQAAALLGQLNDLQRELRPLAEAEQGPPQRPMRRILGEPFPKE